MSRYSHGKEGVCFGNLRFSSLKGKTLYLLVSLLSNPHLGSLEINSNSILGRRVVHWSRGTITICVFCCFWQLSVCILFWFLFVSCWFLRDWFFFQCLSCLISSRFLSYFSVPQLLPSQLAPIPSYYFASVSPLHSSTPAHKVPQISLTFTVWNAVFHSLSSRILFSLFAVVSAFVIWLNNCLSFVFYELLMSVCILGSNLSNLWHLFIIPALQKESFLCFPVSMFLGTYDLQITMTLQNTHPYDPGYNACTVIQNCFYLF